MTFEGEAKPGEATAEIGRILHAAGLSWPCGMGPHGTYVFHGDKWVGVVGDYETRHDIPYAEGLAAKARDGTLKAIR